MFVRVVHFNPRSGVPEVVKRRVCRWCIAEKASVLAPDVGQQIAERSLLRMARGPTENGDES